MVSCVDEDPRLFGIQCLEEWALNNECIRAFSQKEVNSIENKSDFIYNGRGRKMKIYRWRCYRYYYLPKFTF